MDFFKKFKIERFVIEFLFVLALVSLVLFTELSSSTFAEIEYWALEADEKEIAVVATKDDAEDVADKVETYYVKDEATDVSVTVEPSITITQKTYSKKDLPKPSRVNEAAAKIIEDIEAGKTDIKITTTQSFKNRKKVESKVVEKKSADILKGAKKVASKGKPGVKIVTSEVVQVNGEVDSRKVVDQEVIKKAEDKVILVGTKVDDEEDSKENYGSAGKAFNVAKDGKTYKASISAEEMGQKIANYALKFVGNPYVYGGESLTKGADCSGFTMAVFRHFGVSLPHNANTQRNYGKGYSLKNAKPGDIICFPGHCGIYIGNNKIVHAMNVANGITVSTIGYNGKPVVGIRRMFR